MTETSQTKSTMIHAQTKPISVTGFQLTRWNVKEVTEWLAGLSMSLHRLPSRDLFISSFELESAVNGERWGSVDFGDWIVCDESGSFQIIEDRIFKNSYDIVDTSITDKA